MTNKWTFEGKTAPCIEGLNFDSISMRSRSVAHDLEFDMEISIIDGIVKVTAGHTGEHWSTSCNFVERFVQRLVDAHAYVYGFGCLVLIESVTSPEKIKFQNHRYSQEIFEAQHLRPIHSNEDLEFILKGPPLLGEALYNLNLANLLKHETALFVYRAIETIKDAFECSWVVMNSSLKIDSNYLKELAHYSKSARHSVPLPVDGTLRQEMLTRAWEVVDRYIIFLKDDKAVDSLPLLACQTPRRCLNVDKPCSN